MGLKHSGTQGLKSACRPIVLMGGEDAIEWDLYPEGPAILIGAQDISARWQKNTKKI
jgi:hypothetical protein